MARCAGTEIVLYRPVMKGLISRYRDQLVRIPAGNFPPEDHIVTPFDRTLASSPANDSMFVSIVNFSV